MHTYMSQTPLHLITTICNTNIQSSLYYLLRQIKNGFCLCLWFNFYCEYRTLFGCCNAFFLNLDIRKMQIHLQLLCIM
jgi:hypothetical protein